MAHDILPTKDRIEKKISGIDVMCSVCGEGWETLIHLFKECYFARLMAFGSKWGIRLEEWNAQSIQEILEGSLNWWNETFVHPDHDYGTLVIGSLFVCLWRHRNNVVFRKSQKIEEVVAGFERVVEEYMEVNNRHVGVGVASS